MKIAVALLAMAMVSGCMAKDWPFGKLRTGFSSGDIIDGVNAQPGEAPFIVSMRTKSGHFCGGSIIDENWVITAAHCLVNDNFFVIGGLHQRDNEAGTQIREIKSKAYYFIHEDYDGGVGPNDIGLIYISEPFNLNGDGRDSSLPVKKIALASDKYESADGVGVLFGWGMTQSTYLAPILQKLDTKILSYEKCKPLLPDDAPLAPSNVCSHYLDDDHKKASACNGDSGGPLIKFSPEGSELVGIVSWGYIPCQLHTKPSVYTYTAAHKPWIQKTISEFKLP